MKGHLTFTEALLLLVGTQIGAGILGLPYALRRGGLIGVGMVIIMGLITLLTALFIFDSIGDEDTDITLTHLSHKYLGKWFAYITFAGIILYGYGAMIAYIAGISSLLSETFHIPAYIVAVVFWAIMSVLVYLGMKVSGDAEVAIGIILLGALTVAILLVLPQVKLTNLFNFHIEDFLTIIGVSMFAYASHLIVPEIRISAGKEVGRKAVIWGYIIPMSFYALFVLAFVGAYGENVPMMAMIAIQKISSIGYWLAILVPLTSITTSFIGIALSQKHNMRKQLGISPFWALILTTVPPLLIYFAGLKGFVQALSIAGSIGAVIFAGIIPVLLHIKSSPSPRKHLAYSLLALFVGVFVLSLVSM